MKFVIRAFVFLLVLFADAARLLEVPGAGISPLLFVALAAGYGLGSGALAGGAWGFAGGMMLGLLYGDATIGARALGGLLAGSLPAAMKRLLYWRRWPGQVGLGVITGLIFEGVMLAVAWFRGDVAGPGYPLGLRILATALLTGLVCPLFVLLVGRLERIH